MNATLPPPSSPSPSSEPEAGRHQVEARHRDTAQLIIALRCLVHGWDHTIVLSALGILGAQICDGGNLPRAILADVVMHAPAGNTFTNNRIEHHSPPSVPVEVVVQPPRAHRPWAEAAPPRRKKGRR